jgi:putative CocE/NonD family hydrolase
MGATALQAAVDGPPGLKAVFAYITGSTYQDGWIRSGGVFELALNVRWTLAQLAGQLQRPDRAGDIDAAVVELMGRFGADALGSLRATIDPAAYADVLAKAAPFFSDWLERPPGDDYWSRLDIAAAVESDRVHAPILHVAGWYDGFVAEHLALQAALASRGVGAGHRFVAGPWTHDAYFGVFTASTAGDHNFGPVAVGGRPGVGPMALDWFGHWLSGGDPPAIPASPVRYFLMGENQWRDSGVWPPPHTLATWYLRGGGLLSLDAPGDEPCDSYRYDPSDPAPTTGGAHMAYGVTDTGVRDQRALEGRADVVVYTSAHLIEPLTIVGPVSVALHVRSSAPSTDFVATLVDVDEGGGAVNVCDGVQRMEAVAGAPLGGPRLVRIDLHATAYTIAAGHRLRLHVTSSSFPRLERSPTVAVQHLLHDTGHPSAVSLPILIPEVAS